MKNLARIVSYLACLVALTTAVSACGSDRPPKASSSLYWDVSPYGTIQTNDLTRLQKETPFVIILPKYLPNDIARSQPPHFVKLVGSYNPGGVDIIIDYTVFSSQHRLHIDESDSLHQGPPNEQTEFTYLDFGTTRVLEEVSTESTPDKSALVTDARYGWDRNSINFAVEVVAYDQTESRKIVESMIR